MLWMFYSCSKSFLEAYFEYSSHSVPLALPQVSKNIRLERGTQTTHTLSQFFSTFTYQLLRFCSYLPHAGVFAIHNRHVVDFVPLNKQPLGLVQLLRHEAHKGVVRCVGCQGRTQQHCYIGLQMQYASQKIQQVLQ